jgi:hypothetical protein
LCRWYAVLSPNSGGLSMRGTFLSPVKPSRKSMTTKAYGLFQPAQYRGQFAEVQPGWANDPGVDP